MEPLLPLLRGLTLAGQCGMVGGALFALTVAHKSERRRVLRLTALAALAAILTAAAAMVVLTRNLMTALDLGLSEALGAEFARNHVAFMASASLAALLCLLRRTPPWLAVIAASAVVAVSVLGGHAASRVDDRAAAIAAAFVHQMAAGAWLGGIPFLLRALRAPAGAVRIRLCRKFSAVAMVSVAAIMASAMALALIHVGSWAGISGSDFGHLLVIKTAMFVGLLLLGFGNFRAGPRLDQTAPLRHLRCFAAAEIAIGFAILVVAAALGTLPPPGLAGH